MRKGYLSGLVLLGTALLAGCSLAPVSPKTSASSPGQLSVTPTAVAFGSVAVGSSASKTGSLTASTSDVTVSTVDESGEGYSLSGISFPVTVPAGQSVSFTVTFAPQTAGSSPGSLAFLSDASDPSASATLSGTGAQASQHTVSLSWNVSSTSSVVGYNIYRGTVSGGPYPTKLTSSPQAQTSFVDSTVNSSSTYYYVATAVDSDSAESAYSNQAKAVIP
jgi:hypothetical protein